MTNSYDSNICSEIEARYHALRDVIKKATASFPVADATVVLVAVTKQHAAERIACLLQRGHRVFAENRVQEALEKWPSLRQAYADTELHLIGPLQTNKVRQAVGLFDVIETLDRMSLADALQAEAARIGKIQRCHIQVNIGEEPQKSGIAPRELSAFYAYIRTLPSLNVEGLMCIPPEDVAPAPYFELMRRYRQQLDLPALSMGMSGDFEMAIRFGATHVRIGTALMGSREEGKKNAPGSDPDA